jgi:hypothetical protein
MPFLQADATDFIDVGSAPYLMMPDDPRPKAYENGLALAESGVAGKALQQTLELPCQFRRNTGIHWQTIHQVRFP